MAKNIVQLINRNANTDVFMNGKEAVKDVMTYSAKKVRSINDLDQDDKEKIALAIFEEREREDVYSALNLDDMNSNVMSALVKFMQNDNEDSQFDLCNAIRNSFVKYYEADTEELLDEVIYEEFADKAEEAGVKPHVDPINGEVRWY